MNEDRRRREQLLVGVGQEDGRTVVRTRESLRQEAAVAERIVQAQEQRLKKEEENEAQLRRGPGPGQMSPEKTQQQLKLRLQLKRQVGLDRRTHITHQQPVKEPKNMLIRNYIRAALIGALRRLGWRLRRRHQQQLQQQQR